MDNNTSPNTAQQVNFRHFPRLLHPISTPSRCLWRLRMVPLDPSRDSTQPQYYTSWQKLTGKLITPFIENSFVISNEQSQICTPPCQLEFHFNTFRTSDETRSCHTRSGLQFYTQYTKETRTKIGNVSELYTHI